MDEYLQLLSKFRSESDEDATIEVISDEAACEYVAERRPHVYRRVWPKCATKDAYYAVSVYNPTDVDHSFAHLTVVFTPGWASNHTKDQLNLALAAREPSLPSFTGSDAILPAESHTHLRLEFPVPKSIPAGFKFTGLGVLWGPSPSLEYHHYDIGHFYTMKEG